MATAHRVRGWRVGIDKCCEQVQLSTFGWLSRLANFRRWFVAANDCQLHHLLHRFGIGSSKVHPHQRLFFGVLGAVAVIETRFGTRGVTPQGRALAFRFFCVGGCLLNCQMWRLKTTKPELTQACAHRCL